MSYRTFHVSHSSKDGFILNLTERSRFRDFILDCANVLCVVTRHRFCNQIINRPLFWADKKEVSLKQIHIDRETADTLSSFVGAWSFLDD